METKKKLCFRERQEEYFQNIKDQRIDFDIKGVDGIPVGRMIFDGIYDRKSFLM